MVYTITQRKKILVFTQTYLPGVKGGGPIKSISNLVNHLHKEYEFKIITADRDLGDIAQYIGINPNSWNDVGRAKVLYLTPEKCNIFYLKKLLSSINYDLLYLNSYFSPQYTILPLIIRKIVKGTRGPMVIAPRGEFSEGALSIKSLKKKIYIKFAKVIKLYSNCVWQASSEFEKNDIIRIMGNEISPIVAPDLIENIPIEDWIPRYKKEGTIKILFLSRVSKMKNLKGALNLISNLKGEVYFDVYGPIEDKDYWNECLEMINRLPRNITVEYKGPIASKFVRETMQKYHVFLLPTFGENFGHVIAEALSAGCPVIISNMTPWKNLSVKKVGWDIPLDNEGEFIKHLQHCVNVGSESYNKLSKQAFSYGKVFQEENNSIRKNKSLFDNVVNK